MKSNKADLVPVDLITSKIYLIRNEKVLLDFDLAELYGVPTSQLKRAVRRNSERFPIDFMFKLTSSETKNLRCQFGTSSEPGNNSGWGGRRYNPYAFTEQGTAMLSSVLNSDRAIKVNIAIMRAFVQMRKFLQSSDALSKKLNDLEKQINKKFSDQQEQIRIIFEAIKQLMSEKSKPKQKIGF